MKAPASPLYNNGRAIAAAAGGMGSTGQSRVCPALTAVGRQGFVASRAPGFSIPAPGKPGTGLGVRLEPWQAAPMG